MGWDGMEGGLRRACVSFDLRVALACVLCLRPRREMGLLLFVVNVGRGLRSIHDQVRPSPLVCLIILCGCVRLRAGVSESVGRRTACMKTNEAITV